MSDTSTVTTANSANRIHAKNLVNACDYDYTSLGGYPVFALTLDGGILCPACVRVNKGQVYHNTLDRHGDKQWSLAAVDVHWEGEPLICDNCNEEIESAYGNPWADKEGE